jgi:phosphoribosylanthranilate isomerase
MKIKVCGMRDAENIQQVRALGVDMIGLIFWPGSPRYVQSISSHAGLIPDLRNEDIAEGSNGKAKYVGVFVDEMPQNVITQAYNYKLGYIQLHGSESPVYIDNLKRTLVPDILPEVKIIKALSVEQASDIEKWREYKGYADMLLFDTKCKSVGGSGRQFDWSLIEKYDGDIPFLLSGGIGPEDAERVKSFHHPMCIGIDLNSKFEKTHTDEQGKTVKTPGMKDIDKLRTFISAISKTR